MRPILAKWAQNKAVARSLLVDATRAPGLIVAPRSAMCATWQLKTTRDVDADEGSSIGKLGATNGATNQCTCSIVLGPLVG